MAAKLTGSAREARRGDLRWVVWLALVVLMAGCTASSGVPGASDVPRRFLESRPADEVVVFEFGEGSESFVVELALVSSEETVKSEGVAHVPALSPDGGRLAWSGPSETDATWPDVFVRSLDSATVVRIGSGALPRWTPDGKALTVGLPDGLYLLSLDGSSERLLEGSDIDGAMIADDTYIVSSPDELYLQRPATTSSIAAEEGCSAAGFDYDPSGRRVVYVLRCDGEDSAEAAYIYDLGSGRSRRVRSGVFAGVSWSPDGRYFVVAAAPPGRGNRTTELWFVDAGTGALAAREGSGRQVQWPNWGIGS